MWKIKFISNILIFFLCFEFKEFFTSEYDSLESETLHEIATKIINLLDKNTNPCEDIVTYVCKNVTVNNNYNKIYRERLTHTNIDNILHELNENHSYSSQAEIKLKNFVSSCQNKNYKEQFQNLEIAKLMGGWPIITSEWDEKNFDWIQIIGILNKYQINTIFRTKFDTKEKILSIDLISIRTSVETILNNFEQIGFEFDNKEKIFAVEIFNFTESLSNLKPIKYDYTNSQIVKISKFQNDIENFNLTKYLQYYIENSTDENNNSIQIEIKTLENLKNVIDFVHNSDKRILANFIMWRIAMVLSKYSNTCNLEVDFNPIITKIFLRKIFNKKSENLVLEIFDKLNQTLLTSRDNLGEDVFENSIEKLSEITNYFEKHKFIFKNEEIDMLYNNLDIVSDNYLQNVLNSMRHKISAQSLNDNENYKINELKETDFNFEELQILEGYPAAIFYSYFALKFWGKNVFSQYLYDFDNENMNNALKCFQNTSTFYVADELVIRQQILNNEAIQWAFKNFEEWIKENKEIEVKENEILNKYKLNIRKLFLINSIGNICSNYYQIKSSNGILIWNNELIANEFECAKKSQMKCRIFKIF